MYLSSDGSWATTNHSARTSQKKDRSGKGEAYRNLANAYYILGDFQTAIDYLNRDRKIAQEMRNRWGDKRAFENLGMIASENPGVLRQP